MWSVVRWVIVVGLALAAGMAHGEGIVDVLERSQQVRLDRLQLVASDNPRALKIRASFEKLLHGLGPVRTVELRVVRGDTLAETLNGHVVVAHESLGDWPEEDRMFVLAHELGHVALGHWSQMGSVYQKWVPGAVTPEQTDAVAALLGREASSLAHQHEYEADAFAARTLHNLGNPRPDLRAIFTRQGITKDTPTHPGTQKRLASLRAAEASLPPGR
ncbi:MAG TPA: M48 family metalloprotease [Rhizobacter sp.]|nr:M48 family metalloprotease [Rhizobacter sp.]